MSPGAPFDRCLNCKEPFTDQNVFTEAGRREIEISGFCERCFDNLFAEEEPPPAPLGAPFFDFVGDEFLP